MYLLDGDLKALCLFYYISIHAVFDESGNFLLFASMVGIKGNAYIYVYVVVVSQYA